MSRKAKGKRPFFFENPESDKLLAITMAVVGELAVVRDRLDTVERLLEEKGGLSRADIEAYEPDEQVREARHAWRETYLKRVLRIVHHELESEKAGETDEGYAQAIADVAVN
ncbi:hypothetical protein [Algiphilus sp.]|uniref:hypothetical protein n=1 Tax=Algiphilus sp. TaxID=1872431 RepID=UPI0032EF1510